MSHRILLAGIFHETHSFLEGETPLEDFAIRRGAELLTARGDGSPLSGVLEVADDCEWELSPVVDLRATPSATAADDVLDEFWKAFATAADTAGALDGVYLVLHGAMICSSHPDVEGEIIRRIRALPGFENVPICGVLDLHGNISPVTIEQTQGLVAYRCNPHTDSRQAAIDGARLLDRILKTGKRPTGVYCQPPVLWPPTGTGTADDPMRTLESMAREIESDADIEVANVMAGFSFGDCEHAGVSFAAWTFGDPAAARRELSKLSDWAFAHREAGNRVDPPLAQVMPEIAARAARGDGPIVIVEPADNIGGGASGDATSVLRALLDFAIDEAVVAIADAEAVAKLRSAAIGQTLALSIGGKGSRLIDGPLELEAELLSRSDGRFDLEDRHSHLASMAGIHIDMGPSAVVRHHGVRILLTTRKTPPFDLGQFRSQGIEPEGCSVIGVKAAVAHRRAYDKIAKASYTVSTPGPCTSDLKSLPFTRIRRPVFPLNDL